MGEFPQFYNCLFVGLDCTCCCDYFLKCLWRFSVNQVSVLQGELNLGQLDLVLGTWKHWPLIQRGLFSSNCRQKHGCATGSPVSPIVANLNMEEIESRALNLIRGTAQSHINSVDSNIKFTWMSGLVVWLSCTAVYTLKRAGASTMEYTGNPHT